MGSLQGGIGRPKIRWSITAEVWLSSLVSSRYNESSSWTRGASWTRQANILVAIVEHSELLSLIILIVVGSSPLTKCLNKVPVMSATLDINRQQRILISCEGFPERRSTVPRSISCSTRISFDTHIVKRADSAVVLTSSSSSFRAHSKSFSWVWRARERIVSFPFLDTCEHKTLTRWIEDKSFSLEHSLSAEERFCNHRQVGFDLSKSSFADIFDANPPSPSHAGL